MRKANRWFDMSDKGIPAFPIPIIIDSNEQQPYRFSCVQSDEEQRKAMPKRFRSICPPFWAVGWERKSLKPRGDYSLTGHENIVAVERKSHEDLLGTIIPSRSDPGRRDRFEAELASLSEISVAAVVVECDYATLFNPPIQLRIGNWERKVKSVFRSILAYKQRFPTVQWEFCPNRTFAEIMTFQILRRYYVDYWDSVFNSMAKPSLD